MSDRIITNSDDLADCPDDTVILNRWNIILVSSGGEWFTAGDEPPDPHPELPARVVYRPDRPEPTDLGYDTLRANLAALIKSDSWFDLDTDFDATGAADRLMPLIETYANRLFDRAYAAGHDTAKGIR